MVSYFSFMDDEEIKDSVYDYIFTFCDSLTVTFINSVDQNGLGASIKCTPLERVFNGAKKQTLKDKQWGMNFPTYKIKLTKDVKKLLKKVELDSEINISKGKRLENITLMQGEKIIYSVCTHEGYTDIDEEFKNCVSQFCKQQLQTTVAYLNALKKYKLLQSEDFYDLNKKMEILWDIANYVELERTKKPNLIYEYAKLTPKYKCTFVDYLKIAKKIFSADVVRQLEKANSFKELLNDKEYFYTCDLCLKMIRELRFFSVVLQINT